MDWWGQAVGAPQSRLQAFQPFPLLEVEEVEPLLHSLLLCTSCLRLWVGGGLQMQGVVCSATLETAVSFTQGTAWGRG